MEKDNINESRTKPLKQELYTLLTLNDWCIMSLDVIEDTKDYKILIACHKAKTKDGNSVIFE